MIDRERSVLLIIDVQERLAAVMERRAVLARNIPILIESARTFDVPIVLTEQYPEGLGPTIAEIAQALPGLPPLLKMTMDCCAEGTFNARLEQLTQLEQVIVCGMETHICVLQTVESLLLRGKEVHVVQDAVCSRTEDNWRCALERMRQGGAVITCTESVVFELLRVAGTKEFRKLARLIK
jgi:nicotinamidase-related amidase